MTAEVLTVLPNEIMTNVVEIFRTNNIHHIPVVAEGSVKGIISSSDIYKLEHHFTLFKRKNSEEINKALMRTLLAKEVMKFPVVTVNENDTVEFAAGIFRENLFHALPVLNDDKKLVGIITPFDLMNYAFQYELIALDN